MKNSFKLCNYVVVFIGFYFKMFKIKVRHFVKNFLRPQKFFRYLQRGRDPPFEEQCSLLTSDSRWQTINSYK